MGVIEVDVVEVEVDVSLVGASVETLRIVCEGDGGEDEKRLVIHEWLLRESQREETYLLVFENMLVCVVAGTGFDGAIGFGLAACVVGLEALAEVIVFFIAPIAAAPAEEALTFMVEAVILGKSFCGTGLDWVAAAE